MLTYYDEVIYIIHWIIFYSVVNLLTKYYALNNNQTWLLRIIKEDGSPLYAYTSPMIHLGFWLPSVLLYQNWYYNQLNVNEQEKWLIENWHNKSDTFIQEQALLSTIGYMIKDFAFCNMGLMLFLHHVVCIVISFLVLNIRAHNNIELMIMSCCVLEIGTLARNIYICFPNNKTLTLYTLAMQYSNLKTLSWLFYIRKSSEILVIEYFTIIISVLLIIKRFNICNNIVRKSLKRYLD